MKIGESLRYYIVSILNLVHLITTAVVSHEYSATKNAKAIKCKPKVTKNTRKLFFVDDDYLSLHQQNKTPLTIKITVNQL